MKPIRICIMGAHIDSPNRGVQALAFSLINLCEEVSNDGEVILLIGRKSNRPVRFNLNGQEKNIRVVNCRLSPFSKVSQHLIWIVLACLIYRYSSWPYLRRCISRFTPWIEALETADIVGDVRGGDSFSDIYGLKRFLKDFLMAWTVLLIKNGIVQFPQTFGPYNSKLSQILAKYILRHSLVIIARDKKSQHEVKSLIGSSREVWLCPDVAFSLDSVRPEHLEMTPPLKGSLPSDIIGINVNGLMDNGGYTRKNMFGLKLEYRKMLVDLVQLLLKEHPGELWLVPHTYAPKGHVESDSESCMQLRRLLPIDLKSRVRIVTGEYDQNQIKGVIGYCNFFIGSRMHSCIAALSQGIPCVGVAYSKKFDGVFSSVGMKGWVVDGRSVANPEAIDRIMHLYRNRTEVRKQLCRNVNLANEQLVGIFQRLVSATKN